jgi:hypothetical protein
VSKIVTGNVAHDADLLAAEHARQIALAVPGLTRAQAKAADLSFARSGLASSIAKNKGANAILFQTMLKELGQNV